MSQSCALITPSYWRDHAQFEILAASVDRWVPDEIIHYVIVTRADVPLFAPLASPRRKIIVVEDIIPRWLVRMPGNAPFWLSLRTRPVKNWILQQIVKLSVPEVLTEDMLYYVDSDMFFTAPFDPEKLHPEGKTHFFAEHLAPGTIPDHHAWQNVAARMLGLPERGDDGVNYVGQLVPVDRQVACDMLAVVDRVTKRPWQISVAKCSRFSEYMLYGVYVDRHLNQPDRFSRDDSLIVNNYWGTEPLDDAGLKALRDRTEENQVGVMVSAKSNTPAAAIKRAFSDLL